MKIPSDPIGNRTHELPAFSPVPHCSISYPQLYTWEKWIIVDIICINRSVDSVDMHDTYTSLFEGVYILRYTVQMCPTKYGDTCFNLKHRITVCCYVWKKKELVTFWHTFQCKLQSTYLKLHLIIYYHILRGSLLIFVDDSLRFTVA